MAFGSHVPSCPPKVGDPYDAQAKHWCCQTGWQRYATATKATRHEQESRPLIRLNGVRADSPTPGYRRTLPSCDDVTVRVRDTQTHTIAQTHTHTHTESCQEGQNHPGRFRAEPGYIESEPGHQRHQLGGCYAVWHPWQPCSTLHVILAKLPCS